MHTLSDHGRADLAYQLLSNKTYPSWATWSTRVPRPVGAMERRHGRSGHEQRQPRDARGDMAAWLYQRLAGIQSDPEAPGFRRIVMKPHPVGDLGSVAAEYRSIRGPIRSEWKIAEGAFRWSIAIPANTTATIHVPARDGQGITEAQAAGEALECTSSAPSRARPFTKSSRGSTTSSRRSSRRAD